MYDDWGGGCGGGVKKTTIADRHHTQQQEQRMREKVPTGLDNDGHQWPQASVRVFRMEL